MAKAIDWAGVEADYRAGSKPLREIGKQYGISHVAIQKRARAEGWSRDLSQKIRERAAAKVTKAAVTTRVTPVTENAIVEANADLQASLTLSHRADVQKAREILADLFGELKGLTLSREQHEALAELAAAGALGEGADPRSLEKRVEAILASIGFPQRVQGMHKLADTLVKLVTLERTVAGIEDRQTDEGLAIAALKRLAQTAALEANGVG